MKTVTITCEHTSEFITLSVPDNNICCIQCGLIQVFLNPAQAQTVRSHCRCMDARLHPHPDDMEKITMTIDPSQLDLGGETVGPQLIG